MKYASLTLGIGVVLVNNTPPVTSPVGPMMKSKTLLCLLFVVLTVHSHRGYGQDSTTEKRLARALKRIPDADADQDGKLTNQEALAYLELHPELKAMLGGKGNDTNTSTNATAGLPAGPRLFVCAHSFMIFTSQLLPPIVESAGISHRDAGKQMIGGSRVLQHWNLPDEQNEVKAALREGSVDVLTLSPHLQLPDEGIDNFTKLGLQKNPELRVLVQASWPPRDGNSGKFSNAMRDEATSASLDEQRENHNTAFIAKLESQVRALNESLGTETVHIVPVSEAVFALRQRIATGTALGLTKQTDLFRDDLGHPQTPLALLVTYCHFAAIHQRSPVGLPVPAIIKDSPHAEELNRLLQQLAWEAVSNYPLSGVRTAEPVLVK